MTHADRDASEQPAIDIYCLWNESTHRHLRDGSAFWREAEWHETWLPSRRTLTPIAPDAPDRDTSEQPKSDHGQCWDDWQPSDDGDSCRCGYNGTSAECATSRLSAPDAPEPTDPEATQAPETRSAPAGSPNSPDVGTGTPTPENGAQRATDRVWRWREVAAPWRLAACIALADAEVEAATAELRAEHERLIDGLKACWKVDMRAARKAEAQRNDALGCARLLEAMIVQSASDHRAAVSNLEAQLAEADALRKRVEAARDCWRDDVAPMLDRMGDEMGAAATRVICQGLDIALAVDGATRNAAPKETPK